MIELLDNYAPATQMLPNPHIREVELGTEQSISREDPLLQTINNEAKKMSEGVDPRTLPLASMTLRAVEDAQEITTDERSGLLSPKGIEMWFERYKPEKFMVMMCDGRGFGKINKQYGHNVGNKVIEFIGQGITDRLRISEDDAVDKDRRKTDARDAVGSVSGRWGGDEFISVVDLTGLSDAEVAAAQQSILKRFDDFGTYEDDVYGDIPVSIRAVSVLGSANEDKSFTAYQAEVDEFLKDLVTKEQSEAK